MLNKKLGVFVFVFLFAVAVVSAGLFSKFTGEITSQPVDINITVSSGNAPSIYAVWTGSMTDVSSGLNEGPLATYVLINFSVSDNNGYENLDDASALINFSSAGEDTREVSCSRIASESSGNYANYTCNVTMWWWDGAGTWDIHAHIADQQSNVGTNNTESFTVGTTAGFQVSPTSLTWSTISPGATNQEANEYMVLNNTGNLVRNVQINATNLYGESNNAQALWAANFSAHTAAGCEGTGMVAQTFTSVSGASLPIGNYTVNDGTGQEDVYYCLEAANPDLDPQAYSTQEAGSWTIKIVA